MYILGGYGSILLLVGWITLPKKTIRNETAQMVEDFLCTFILFASVENKPHIDEMQFEVFHVEKVRFQIAISVLKIKKNLGTCLNKCF